MQLGYRYLEHKTDAFIEVRASDLKEAFLLAGQSAVQTMLDSAKIEEKKQKNITVLGKDLRYLLYNWLEEIIIITITDGFAIKKFCIDIQKNNSYKIIAKLFGEDIDIQKHHFKVEIKSPTFHLMEITQQEEKEKQVVMRFLLDL